MTKPKPKGKTKPPGKSDAAGAAAYKYMLFAREYVALGNAKQAAINVGYSKPSAARTGHDLLQRDDVKAEVKRLQDNVAEAAGINAVMVARELAAVAFANMGNFATWDGGKVSLTPSDKVADKRPVSEVSEATEGRVKIKLHDKIQALTALNKMLGFNAVEKQELTINKSHEEALDELE